MSSRRYAPTSRSAANGRQQSVFGKTSLERPPSQLFNGNGAPAEGDFGWSSTPEACCPWKQPAGGKQAGAAMKQSRMSSSSGRNAYAGSQTFRGQGPGGGPAPQPVDRHGHARRQQMWDQNHAQQNPPFVPQSSTAGRFAASRANNGGRTSSLKQGKQNWSVQDMHSFIRTQGGSRDVADSTLPREFQNSLHAIGGRFGQPQRMTNLPDEVARFARPFVSQSDKQAMQQQNEQPPPLAPPQQLQNQRRQMAQQQQQQRQQQNRAQQQQQQMSSRGYMGLQSTQSLIESMNNTMSHRETQDNRGQQNEMALNSVISQFGRPMQRKSVPQQQSPQQQQQQQRQEQEQSTTAPRIARPRGQQPPRVTLPQQRRVQQEQQIGQQQQQQTYQIASDDFVEQQQHPQQRRQQQQPTFWDQERPVQSHDDRAALFEQEEKRLQHSVQKAAPRLRRANANQNGGQQQQAVPQATVKTLNVSKHRSAPPPNKQAPFVQPQLRPMRTTLPSPGEAPQQDNDVQYEDEEQFDYEPQTQHAPAKVSYVPFTKPQRPQAKPVRSPVRQTAPPPPQQQKQKQQPAQQVQQYEVEGEIDEEYCHIDLHPETNGDNQQGGQDYAQQEAETEQDPYGGEEGQYAQEEEGEEEEEQEVEHQRAIENQGQEQQPVEYEETIDGADNGEDQENEA